MMKPEQLPRLFKSSFTPGKWSEEYIGQLTRTPSDPEDYPNALEDILLAFESIKNNWPDKKPDNLRVLVIGSISPWIECFLLHLGVRHVFTTDVEPIQIKSSQITFINISDKLCGKFDLIVSYSTIEHIGLGRYGDPIDPDGDLKEMAKIRSMLVKDGFLMLGVPVAQTYILDVPWHRIYGPKRLEELVHGFKVLGSFKFGAWNDHVDFSQDPRYVANWQNQPVIILQRRPFFSGVIATRNDNFEGDPLHRLSVSLKHNVHNLGPYFGDDFELMVGDWGSEKAITHEMLGTSSPTVKIYHFPHEITQHFPSSFDEVHPLNYLIRHASGQYVARLDQDILIGPTFISYMVDHLKDGHFYWSTRRDLPQEVEWPDDARSIINYPPDKPDFYQAAIGLILTSSRIWHKARGYNEGLVHRNHMEHDLYKRLLNHAQLVNIGQQLSCPFYHLWHTRTSSASRKVNELVPFANDENWGLVKFGHLVTRI